MSEEADDDSKKDSANSTNRLIALVTAGLAALAALAAALGNYEKIYAFFVKPEPASIEIGFVEQAGVTSDIIVSPVWNDYAMSGFSQPIELPLVVRNAGGVVAQNLKVRFIFPDPVGFYVRGDGAAIKPGQLSDVASITGYETVTEFEVSDLGPSKVYSLLDENLALAFRLRERVGVPFVYSDVAMVAPMWMDFGHKGSSSGRTMPIDYVVSMDGAEEVAGRITVSLDGELFQQIQNVPRGGDITLELVDDFPSPVLAAPKSEETRSLLFYEGRFNELVEFLADQGLAARVSGTELSVTQYESDGDVWQKISMASGDITLLIDREKDGSLDEVFVGISGNEEVNWIMMRPGSIAPFTGIHRTVDLSKETGIVEQAGEILTGATPRQISTQ